MLSNQSSCTAALALDQTGAGCSALKCTYKHGSLLQGSVRYETFDSSAMAISGDYASVSGVVNFTDNQRFATISINTFVDEVFDEGTEKFAVRLSQAKVGLLGGE
eukprot:COSAG01_NODE_52245_length_348_cov_0.618474_1_plen_104_part_10